MNCIKCNAALPDGAVYCPMCGKKQVQEKRKALKRANGTGTVYKLQGRRKRPWVAAKNRVVIGYYERKTDALEALERLSGKDLTERYNMTFAEVFETWKAEHYKEIGPKGVESYDRAFAVFSPIHEKKFRDLRTADFQSVLDAHMKKSHSTVSKYKQLLTQMSQWAIREEICTTNFAKFVRLPESVKKEREIFTDEEIQKIEADGSETSRIILMLLSTGMADWRTVLSPLGGLPRNICDRRLQNRCWAESYYSYPGQKGENTFYILLNTPMDPSFYQAMLGIKFLRIIEKETTIHY